MIIVVQRSPSKFKWIPTTLWVVLESSVKTSQGCQLVFGHKGNALKYFSKYAWHCGLDLFMYMYLGLLQHKNVSKVKINGGTDKSPAGQNPCTKNDRWDKSPTMQNIIFSEFCTMILNNEKCYFFRILYMYHDFGTLINFAWILGCLFRYSGVLIKFVHQMLSWFLLFRSFYKICSSNVELVSIIREFLSNLFIKCWAGFHYSGVFHQMLFRNG